MSHRRKQIQTLSWLMDRSIPLPGGYRIGLDGFLGLIPGVGDVVSSTVSGWIVLLAYQEGVPLSVLLRMLVNVGIDLVFGSIPIVGDLFDFAFKANVRNLALLQRYHQSPSQTRRQSQFNVFVVFFIALMLLILLTWGFLSLLSLVWNAVYH